METTSGKTELLVVDDTPTANTTTTTTTTTTTATTKTTNYPTSATTITAESIGLSKSSSEASLPKLKITFKMPTNTSMNDLTAQPATKLEPVAKKPKATKGTSTGVKGKSKAKLVKGEDDKSKPNGQLVNDQSAGSTKNNKSSTDQSTTNKSTAGGGEKREASRPQFADQVEQVKRLKTLKTRKWSHEPVNFLTIGGNPLTVPMWVREGGFVHPPEPGSRRNSLNGLQATTTSSTATVDEASDEVFTCDFEGCKKVFNAKDKLKRHQNMHKKKLQLKLPSMKIIKQQKEQTNQSHDMTRSQSDMPSEVQFEEGLAVQDEEEEDVSKLDSELL